MAKELILEETWGHHETKAEVVAKDDGKVYLKIEHSHPKRRNKDWDRRDADDCSAQLLLYKKHNHDQDKKAKALLDKVMKEDEKLAGTSKGCRFFCS